MATAYEEDIVAWAREQAALLRAGQLLLVDVEHIAEEIDDVGKRERHQLASRLSVLLAHILKWQMQPARRGSSWEVTIATQRRAIARLLRLTPSLKSALHDPEFAAAVWDDAVIHAIRETGLHVFPQSNPWTMAQVMDPGFLPDALQGGIPGAGRRPMAP